MNSTASVMVNNAQKMLNMANSIESGNGLQNAAVNTATNAMVQVANNTMKAAANVNAATVSANSAVSVASNISTNTSVKTAVSSVVNATLKADAPAVVNAAVNAANSVLAANANASNTMQVPNNSQTVNVVNKSQAANVVVNNKPMNGAQAANVVANAATAAAVNVEAKEVANVAKNVKALNAKLNNTKTKINPTNPMRERFSKAVSVNSKNTKKMIYTAEGNIKALNNKNGAKVIKVNGQNRVVLPKLVEKTYNKHNKSAQKTGRQVYKQGELRNIYKNKNGKFYTVMNGAMGNMKNFMFKGANGLFGGIKL